MRRRLSPTERMFWVWGQRLPVNIAFVVRVRGRCDHDRARRVIVGMRARHPGLAVRVEAPGPFRAWFSTEGVPDPEISVSRVDRLPGAAEQVQLMRQETKRAFDTAAGPLARFVIRDAGDEFDLMVVCHHAAADGKSLIILTRDILTSLAGLPLEMTPVRAADHADRLLLARARGLADLPGVLRTLRGAARGGAGARLFAEPGGDRAYLGWQLDAPDAVALLDRCRREGASLQAALCVAFARACQDLGASGPLRVAVAADLRPLVRLRPREVFGLNAASLFFPVRASAEQGFWDAARLVGADLRDPARIVEARQAIRLARWLAALPSPWLCLLSRGGGRGRAAFDISFSTVRPLGMPTRYGSLRVVGSMGLADTSGPGLPLVATCGFGDQLAFTLTAANQPMARRLAERARTHLARAAEAADGQAEPAASAMSGTTATTATAATAAIGESAAARLPPGPRSPAWWQSIRLWRRPYEFLDACAARHGDTFTLDLLGHGKFVLVSSPEAIRQVFTASADALAAGQARAILTLLMGPDSAILLDGARQQWQRRLLMPHFHRGNVARGQESAVRITARHARSWPTNEPFRLYRELDAIAVEVIVDLFFGAEAGAAEEIDASRARAAALILDFVRAAHVPVVFHLPALAQWGGLGPWRACRQAKGRLDQAIEAELTARQARGDLTGPDIFSVVLKARAESPEQFDGVSLRDVVMPVLIAGYEATAATLAWAFELILAHPDAERRLRAEIEEQAPDGALTPEALDRMRLLDSVILEAARLGPINPFIPRRVLQPIEVDGYLLPAGVHVAANSHGAHRRAAAHQDPRSFRPDRFLGRKPDMFAWLPFGGGARKCLGMSFALGQMKAIIASVLLNSRLRLVNDVVAASTSVGDMAAPADGAVVVKTPDHQPVSAAGPGGPCGR